MYPSPVTDLRTFVPAKDAELSKRFYTDLGFTINWSDEQIAELQIGSFRFLLQTFYVAEHAGNFMMSLSVENADAWWEHIQRKELAKIGSNPNILTLPPMSSRDRPMGSINSARALTARVLFFWAFIAVSRAQTLSGRTGSPSKKSRSVVADCESGTDVLDSSAVY